MRSALQQDNVLNAIMAKIHPTLVVGVSNVKTGFFSFVNYVWEGLKKDSFKTAEHLRRIFSPILEAASSVYLSEIPKPKTTKRAREAARSSTVPANIVFLHNLRNRQRTEIPNGSFDADSEASYQEESSSEQSIPRPIHYSSPPAIPRFEDQELSPLDPAVLLRGNIRLPETRPLPDYQTHSIGFPSPSPMFYYSPPTLPGSAENLSPRPFDSAPGPSLGRGENNPASTRFAYAGFNLSQRINAETRSPLLLPAATIFSTPAASRTSYTAAAAADEEFAALLANGPTSPEVLAAGASQFSLHNVGGESGTPVHEQQTQELTAAELEYFIYEKEVRARRSNSALHLTAFLNSLRYADVTLSSQASPFMIFVDNSQPPCRARPCPQLRIDTDSGIRRRRFAS
ncbi:hypothetical protein B0H16DRAFT_524144 [Mycena metata]|uniref:Uncharacterized protein n=1 Tax=Mycena metata TaxID=1033252 RepID=A0AAD7H861_9AGAR|nr:hypothetical protein B0H16DRAFT_524144 [Mycena metata]